MTKWLNLLLIAAVAIALLLLTLFLSNLRDGEKYRKKIVLYFVSTGILIAVTSLIGYYKFDQLPIWLFIIANLWLLVIGMLHSLIFSKVIPVDMKPAAKLLFSLASFLLGYGFMFLVFKIALKNPFQWIFLSPGICFLIPSFIEIAFNNFTAIPGMIFREWDFPPPGTLSDPNDSEMADPLIINLEIRKGVNDNRTVFKAKAPKGLTLGRLFYYFIIDYNSRYPDNPILISESENSYFRWSFLMTGSVFSGKVYLDPDLTISDNKIKENLSITCERILV